MFFSSLLLLLPLSHPHPIPACPTDVLCVPWCQSEIGLLNCQPFCNTPTLACQLPVKSPLTPLLPEAQDCLPSTGVADLSFEAESPLAPPAELLERLPSYDWLFQRGGKSVGSCFLQPLPGAYAGCGDLSGTGQRWDTAPFPWGALGSLLSPLGGTRST